MTCAECKYFASKTVSKDGSTHLEVGCRKHKKSFGHYSQLHKAKVCDDWVVRSILEHATKKVKK